jgi:plastocyanin
MRTFITAAIVLLLAATNYAFAQQDNPDIRGPARRTAAPAAQAQVDPSVEKAGQGRQTGRPLASPDAWRMRYYNNEWWYYTSQNSWVYHRDNRWVPYDAGTFRALPSRDQTGDRRTETSRNRDDPFAYGKPGAPDLIIGIGDGSFAPQEIIISTGTTIRWLNRGLKEHTVTADNGSWDSGEIAPKGSYSARFKQAGTYPFHCDFDKNMMGIIVVVAAATAPEPVVEETEGDTYEAGSAAEEADIN